MTIQEARSLLAPLIRDYDNRGAHIEYDRIMSLRLAELDPEFMREMARIKNGPICKIGGFWYA